MNLLNCFIYTLVFVSLSNAQLINLKDQNKTVFKQYELYTSNNIINSFDFLVDVKCSDSQYDLKLTENFECKLNVVVYEGYNHNLEFMLEFVIIVKNNYGNFDGFEIKIFDYKTQTTNCIQIQSVNPNAKQFESIKFILKDPTRFESIDRNKFIFYFGKISLNTLTRSRNGFTSDEIITHPIDIGIESLNKSASLEDYDFGENCEAIVHKTCLHLLLDDEHNPFVLIIHPMQKEFNSVKEKIGFTSQINIFYSYNYETHKGLVYKLHPVSKSEMFYTNYYDEASSDYNKCSRDDQNRLCYCQSQCVQCYNEKQRLQQSIHIYYSNYSKTLNTLCKSSPYSSISFNGIKIKKQFQNKAIKAESTPVHLNDYLPQVCVSIATSDRTLYTHGHKVTLFELTIKLNDADLVSQSSLFNISYIINVHDSCGNRISTLVKPYETFSKMYLTTGYYIIEIVPDIKSQFCQNTCPYFNTRLNEVSCESCKKIIQSIEMKSSIRETCFEKSADLVVSDLIDSALRRNNNESLIVDQSILVSNRYVNKTNKLCTINIDETGPLYYLFLIICIVGGPVILIIFTVISMRLFIICYESKMRKFNIGIYICASSSLNNNDELRDTFFFKILQKSFPNINFSLLNFENLNENDSYILVLNKRNDFSETFGTKIGKTENDDLFNLIVMNARERRKDLILLRFNESEYEKNESIENVLIFEISKDYKRFVQYLSTKSMPSKFFKCVSCARSISITLQDSSKVKKFLKKFNKTINYAQNVEEKGLLLHDSI